MLFISNKFKQHVTESWNNWTFVFFRHAIGS